MAWKKNCAGLSTPQFDFEPLPPPQSGDWLAEHREPGQTYEDYLSAHPPQPTSARSKIYIQPLGEFIPKRSPALDVLGHYGRIYFGLPTPLLSPLSLCSLSLTTRHNPFTGKKQILTVDVLATLGGMLPHDAFALLAITMEDLYPEPSWNFVFGQASQRHKVGVFSFARYDPAFYGLPRGKDYAQLLLKRSGQVLVHELGHMFYLAHCIFFHCVMNGSNHLAESDARP